MPPEPLAPHPTRRTRVLFELDAGEPEGDLEDFGLEDLETVDAASVLAELRAAGRTRREALAAWDLLDEVDVKITVEVPHADGTWTGTHAQWSYATDRAEREAQS